MFHPSVQRHPRLQPRACSRLGMHAQGVARHLLPLSHRPPTVPDLSLRASDTSSPLPSGRKVTPSSSQRAFGVPRGCRRVADETRTRDLPSHNPPTYVATRCKIGLSRPICLRTVAHDCCVLRPGWCQQMCQYRPGAPPTRPSKPTCSSSEQVHPRGITSRCVTVARSSGQGRACGHACRARSRTDCRGFRPSRRRTDRLSCRVPSCPR